MVNNIEGFTIMKDTDKVTLTLGQIKKLVKESKSVKESNYRTHLETKVYISRDGGKNFKYSHAVFDTDEPLKNYKASRESHIDNYNSTELISSELTTTRSDETGKMEPCVVIIYKWTDKDAKCYGQIWKEVTIKDSYLDDDDDDYNPYSELHILPVHEKKNNMKDTDKVTLTVGQLKRLIKEANEENNVEWYTPEQIAIFNNAIKKWCNNEEYRYETEYGTKYLVKMDNKRILDKVRTNGVFRCTVKTGRSGRKYLGFFGFASEHPILISKLDNNRKKWVSPQNYSTIYLHPYIPRQIIYAVRRVGFILVNDTNNKIQKIPAREFEKWATGQQNKMSFATDSPRITSTGGINGGTDVEIRWSDSKGIWIKVSDWDLGFTSYT